MARVHVDLDVVVGVDAVAVRRERLLADHDLEVRSPRLVEYVVAAHTDVVRVTRGSAGAVAVVRGAPGEEDVTGVAVPVERVALDQPVRGVTTDEDPLLNG